MVPDVARARAKDDRDLRDHSMNTRAARKSRPGFSMVEMVAVVVIIGTLAGIAVPRYASFSASHRAEATARRIATDITLAQRNARITSNTQEVRFYVASDKYTLLGMTDPDHPAGVYWVHLADEPYGATLVAAEFGGGDNIQFDGYGAPIPNPDDTVGGSIVLQVGSIQKIVSVDGKTGRATVVP